MAKPLNRFLSSIDASFLYLEKPTETMHIGGTMVYEGHIPVEEVKRLLIERLDEIPRYRQRVVFPPMGFSHPLWVDDADFDIDRHIDVVELPEDADERVLAEAAAAAYQGMLPRDRPLWHATLLHGVSGSDTAIVWKIHHAMIDGVSGVDLTMAMNDLTPDPEPRAAAAPWSPKPIPDAIALAQESAQHRLTEIAQAWTEGLFSLLRPTQLAGRGRKLVEALSTTLPTALKPAPKTPFNGKLSGNLGFAWAEFSFTELRQIKSEIGGTLNDLVLTILSGAIARYLEQEDAPVAEDAVLRAMCPVSMRAADEHGQLGNLVSIMMAPLPVTIRDPLERHAEVRAGMDNLKEVGQAEALFDLTKVSERIPPLMQALAGRLPRQNTVLNTVSTNVPGPQIPLYQGGHKLLRWLPMGIVSNNIGLFVAILTYNRRMVIGLTVDRALVADPWQVAQCLYDSQEELREAAGVEHFEEFELTTVPAAASADAAKPSSAGSSKRKAAAKRGAKAAPPKSGVSKKKAKKSKKKSKKKAASSKSKRSAKSTKKVAKKATSRARKKATGKKTTRKKAAQRTGSSSKQSVA